MFSANEIYHDAQRFISETARSVEYADLAGEPAKPVYKASKAEIGKAIAILKRAHAELCELEGHAHRWNSDDYCSICGADGRA